ncbi:MULTISPECIES: AraC family transcriptional regulator [unclassified Lentimonas]|uniref:helix-turn-helix domain-containing protein n=1 Tax=unclassified Lentimonas TaxID=2630993 RepID=UPI001320D3D4|nr:MULTISPECIES: AraC family transcriptional regulator [unclassified Lentimonas]CAA6679330.1 Unannotated [Lentimonas sp. CC4]CAA6686367.1 Unannotated [Lentimonas sp. CC6]CAA7076141.1 Unannotated [Lentimonas sp. CC4]CAA7170866.1 Unannotated [Lentimonas sp. CC21]CAA7181192.1 Unannotated [Lentimonas sp. CC8]
MKHPSIPVPLGNPDQIERAHYYSVPKDHACNSQVQLLHGGYQECRNSYHFRRDHYSHHCLVLITGGRGECWIDEHYSHLQTGTAYLYRPGSCWREKSDQSMPLRKHFAVFQADEWLNDDLLARSNPFIEVHPIRPAVALLETITSEAHTASETQAAVCQHLFDALLLKLRTTTETATPLVQDQAHRTYSQVLKLIEKDYLTLRSVDDIALKMNIDPSYIARLFKRYHDTTPYRCLIAMKMNHAMNQLLNTSDTVTKIALDIGFDNPFHFTRAFKTIHSIPPTHYRNQQS